MQISNGSHVTDEGLAEELSFEAFARTRLAALLRFATVLTGDRGLGEDIVQEVMMRTQARWAHIAGLDEPLLYVRRMVVNEFVSWRRKWARVVPHSDVAVLGERVSPDPAARQAERAALADDIARLPRKQRAVLVLRYYEDLPDDEIAALLGCSASTVRVHALRGLRALRVRLGVESDATALRRNP